MDTVVDSLMTRRRFFQALAASALETTVHDVDNKVIARVPVLIPGSQIKVDVTGRADQ